MFEFEVCGTAMACGNAGNAVTTARLGGLQQVQHTAEFGGLQKCRKLVRLSRQGRKSRTTYFCSVTMVFVCGFDSFLVRARDLRGIRASAMLVDVNIRETRENQAEGA